MRKTKKETQTVKMNVTVTEPEEARYLDRQKRKQVLAGVDSNITKLQEEQKTALTGVLINIKSKYDNIVREVKQATDKTSGIIVFV